MENRQIATAPALGFLMKTTPSLLSFPLYEENSWEAHEPTETALGTVLRRGSDLLHCRFTSETTPSKGDRRGLFHFFAAASSQTRHFYAQTRSHTC